MKVDSPFNATNILRQTRGRWIDLFADYDARIELVYVEPPFNDLLKQNKNRQNPVPEQVVRKLAAKCEPPTWIPAIRQRLPIGGRGRHARREPREIPYSACCHQAACQPRPVRGTEDRLAKILRPRRCPREMHLPLVQRRIDQADSQARSPSVTRTVAEANCSVPWLGRRLLGSSYGTVRRVLSWRREQSTRRGSTARTEARR